jgi:hypothetical protein
MKARLLLSLLMGVVLTLPVVAQNVITNGDFENGQTGWKLVGFNDPAGKTGVRMADVNGTGDTTQALYADFQTLTPVMYAQWSNAAFKIVQGTYPVSAAISWEKKVTTPIPSASVNRVEFRLYDANVSPAKLITNIRKTVPNQTGLIERALFQSTFSIPATGAYYFELYLRHSNLAGIPFICNVDDFACGEFGATINSSGSAKIGGTLSLILYSPSAASKAYAAGCSFGTGPIPIDTRRINLSPDALLVLSTSGLLPAVFSGFSGSLDGSGNSVAKIVIPNSAAIVGIKVRNAFLTLDAAAPSGILTLSNTCAFTIQS